MGIKFCTEWGLIDSKAPISLKLLCLSSQHSTLGIALLAAWPALGSKKAEAEAQGLIKVANGYSLRHPRPIFQLVT